MAIKDLIPWNNKGREVGFLSRNEPHVRRRVSCPVRVSPGNGLSWFGPRSTSHIYKSVNEPVMR